MPQDGTLAWKPVALAGGLHDSKPIPEPGDLQSLTNWTLFRGRFALRGPLAETVQLMDDAGTPAPVTSILAIEYHVANCYVVAHSTAENKTYLYKLKLNGNALDDAATEAPLVGGTASLHTVWTGASVPQVTMVSFEGGSASAGIQRLYITDASGVYNPVYWDSTGSDLVEVKEDFDDDGTKENLSFPLIFEYNDFLFGTDFRQSNAFQLGLLRFSQPGLIPADEPGVTNNIQREWWNSDFRQIGSRGDKIIGVSDAGAAKILFKRRRVYSFHGFDPSSWVLRLIAGGENLGVVGPHASAALPDGTSLFWSDKGPQLTDGKRIIDIGEMIKRRVVAVTIDTDISVEYSPDEGLCYVVVPDDDAGPYIYYAWDVNAQRWVGEGSWKATGGSDLRMRDLRAISDDALPGPAAAPTIDDVAVDSDVQLTVNWTNGDTALDILTDVHRSTSSGFTPNSGNRIKIAASGVASYTDGGLDAKTTYYYKLIHRRNGQSSVESNEGTAKTALATPTSCTAETLVNGVKVKVTNNQDGTPDIVIERRPPAGEFSVLVTLTNQASVATGILTLAGNAVDGEKVTINGKAYTFQDTLTDVDGNVFIEATASDSIDNLIAAITLGAGSGTKYAAAMTLHSTVTATAGSGDTMDAAAKTPGPDGNSIATTETLGSGSWGAATLSGGEIVYDDTTATCDLEYDYRVKAIDAGETDSPYSNEATAVACQDILDITSVSHVATLEVLNECNNLNDVVVVSWSGDNFSSGDTAKIYQNSDRGGYVLRATVPLTDPNWADLWPYAIGSQDRFLRYKVEGWENGTVLKDTLEGTESTEATQECPD